MHDATANRTDADLTYGALLAGIREGLPAELRGLVPMLDGVVGERLAESEVAALARGQVSWA